MSNEFPPRTVTGHFRPARACAGLVVAVTVLASGQASALECPVAHPENSPVALRETQAQIKTDAQMLAAQGSDAIPTIVHGVRQKHPRAGLAEITNYLVTTYCPVLQANAALSETEKRARLVAFSSQVSRELAR